MSKDRGRGNERMNALVSFGRDSVLPRMHADAYILRHIDDKRAFLLSHDQCGSIPKHA